MNIKLAPQKLVTRHHKGVAMAMEILRHPEALVTDWSEVRDFESDDVPLEIAMGELAETLGYEINVELRTPIWRVGKYLERVRYGAEAEDWGAGRHDCGDCGAEAGDFHALGCDVERCAVCGLQAITCGHWEGDDEDRTDG